MDRSESEGTPVLTGVFSFSGRTKWTAPAFTEGCIRQHPATRPIRKHMNTEIMNSEQKPAPVSSETSGGEPTAAPPCVTRFELADLLQVSVRTVDRMIAAGEIPVRRVRGKAVRFLRSDVEQYLGRSSSSTTHPVPLPDRGGEGAKSKSTNPAL